MIRPHWVVLPLLAVTSAAEPPKQPEVRLAQSPARLSPRGTAITYYVEGPKASWRSRMDGTASSFLRTPATSSSSGSGCRWTPRPNEDGIAIAVVDYFGFPANLKSDYDSVITKAS